MPKTIDDNTLRRPTRRDHEDCLHTAAAFEGDLTEAERHALFLVITSAITNKKVTLRVLNRTREICRRMDRMKRFRFITFDMITGQPTAYAPTAKEALENASEHLFTLDYLEVLDCGNNGLKVWTGNSNPPDPILLPKARANHRTVFRGAAYSYRLPPVKLEGTP